ncbi:apelin [Petaurus breviceps papuanus]|uniref:apelin n=1 Tax=Petaurus breviceps papuanus TaxID=3040969 RepID=UPI0036D927D4
MISKRFPSSEVFSLLTFFFLPSGPLVEALDRKELEEGNIRTLVQPKVARTGGPWQGGRRKFRRQRPRLSHKGPMPF